MFVSILVISLILLTLDLIATTWLLTIVLKRAGYPIPVLRKRKPKGPYYA